MRSVLVGASNGRSWRGRGEGPRPRAWRLWRCMGAVFVGVLNGRGRGEGTRALDAWPDARGAGGRRRRRPRTVVVLDSIFDE